VAVAGRNGSHEGEVGEVVVVRKGLMPIEGSLRIIWMNRYTLALPLYHLFFLPYANPTDGAQKPHEIVGDDALESYLVVLGFTPADAHRWLAKVRGHDRAVLISNVMIPDTFLADYEPPKAAEA
jgi:hypothetical protein